MSIVLPNPDIMTRKNQEKSKDLERLLCSGLVFRQYTGFAAAGEVLCLYSWMYSQLDPSAGSRPSCH